MRIVVFGGTGDRGRRAVQELLAEPAVSHITLAGRDLAAARRVREQLGGGHANLELAQVDIIANEARVADLMARHDVAVGAAGPFYLLEMPLIRAAIKAGTPYVSICDDHDAISAALALEEQARAAAVSIIPGIGWTPGLSNLFAKHAADEMAEIEQIHIAWAGSAADAGGAATVMHTMHIMVGSVPTWLNGTGTLIAAGSEPETVDFGGTVGAVRVVHAGHPEPITIPRHITGLREVTLKGGLVESYAGVILSGVIRLGLASSHQRRAAVTRLWHKLTPVVMPAALFPPRDSGLVVRCIGRQEGRRTERVYRATGPMGELTSVPLAVAAVWVGQGRVERHGVFGPEAPGGLPAAEFLEELRRRGINWELTTRHNAK